MLSVETVQELLTRNDPLGAWSVTGNRPGDYRAESEVVAAQLREIKGVGHARALLADALDQVHPGFYQASGDNLELAGRMTRLARDVWDRRVRDFGLLQADMGGVELAGLKPAILSEPLLSDEEQLTTWLRHVELKLFSQRAAPPAGRTGAAQLHRWFPSLLDCFLDSMPVQRDGMRRAVSRFYRVRRELSAFAAHQLHALTGPEAVRALRLAVLAESLLDGGLDWRDELLFLRDLRRRAEALGLPFQAELEQAAKCAAPDTATFLLGIR